MFPDGVDEDDDDETYTDKCTVTETRQILRASRQIIKHYDKSFEYIFSLHITVS